MVINMAASRGIPLECLLSARILEDKMCCPHCSIKPHLLQAFPCHDIVGWRSLAKQPIFEMALGTCDRPPLVFVTFSSVCSALGSMRGRTSTFRQVASFPSGLLSRA